jgi:hypothetical protein
MISRYLYVLKFVKFNMHHEMVLMERIRILQTHKTVHMSVLVRVLQLLAFYYISFIN